MEDNQRKRILQNIDTLVRQTDFEKLTKACLSFDLLTSTMLSNIYNAEPQKTSSEQWNEEMIKNDRHKRLFEKITKRGPEAFGKICLILQHLKYKDALNTLNGNDDRMISISQSKETGKPTIYRNDVTAGNLVNNNIDINERLNRQLSHPQSVDEDDKTLHKCEKFIAPKKEIIVRKAKAIMRHEKIDIYPMDNKTNRGVLFVLNNIKFPVEDDTRYGATEDASSLLSLFKQLNFQLYSYTNLTRNEFMQLLKELLALDEVKDTQCFVLALMTHGHLDAGVQRVTFSDGSVEKVEEIEKLFYHENCQNLVGKPKIFIYPYCRGELADKGVIISDDKIQTEGVCYERRANNIAQFTDVIKCYATTEGFLAHRDMDVGSWYIQCFVDTLAERACDTSFEDMLKLIQTKVERIRTEHGRLQTPGYVNTGFNKILFLNPGV